MPSDASARGLILVVEDDTAIADVVRMNLANAGYGVHIEHDGTAGLAAVQRFRPAAVILDVGLPGLCAAQAGRRSSS